MIEKCSTIVVNHILFVCDLYYLYVTCTICMRPVLFVCDLYFRHRKSFRLSGRILGTLPYRYLPTYLSTKIFKFTIKQPKSVLRGQHFFAFF